MASISCLSAHNTTETTHTYHTLLSPGFPQFSPPPQVPLDRQAPPLMPPGPEEGDPHPHPSSSPAEAGGLGLPPSFRPNPRAKHTRNSSPCSPHLQLAEHCDCFCSCLLCFSLGAALLDSGQGHWHFWSQSPAPALPPAWPWVPSAPHCCLLCPNSLAET